MKSISFLGSSGERVLGGLERGVRAAVIVRRSSEVGHSRPPRLISAEKNAYRSLSQDSPQFSDRKKGDEGEEDDQGPESHS